VQTRRPSTGQGCATISLLLFVALPALVVAIIAIGVVVQPEPTVPTCQGATMRPGDTCFDAAAYTSTPATYDEQLARDQRAHDSGQFLGLLGAAAGILVLGACGYTLLRRQATPQPHMALSNSRPITAP
jgi:hypothetical protein